MLVMIDVHLGHSSWVVPFFLVSFPYPLVGLALHVDLLLVSRVHGSGWRRVISLDWRWGWIAEARSPVMGVICMC